MLTIHQAIELENNSDGNDSPWPDYPHWTVLSSGRYYNSPIDTSFLKDQFSVGLEVEHCTFF